MVIIVEFTIDLSFVPTTIAICGHAQTACISLYSAQTLRKVAPVGNIRGPVINYPLYPIKILSWGNHSSTVGVFSFYPIPNNFNIHPAPTNL